MEELSQLIAGGENQTVEFKRNFGEDAVEAIAALANAEGGYVFIGVEDDGAITGITVGKKTLEDWANKIQASIDPRIQPAIQTMTVTSLDQRKREVGVIKVSPTVSNSVSVNGRFLKRVGKTNQRMSGEQIAQKIMADTGLSWDSAIQQDSAIEDIDLEEVSHFIDSVRKTNRLSIPAGEKPVEVLTKLRLVINEKPTRAAILLFGRDPQRFFPSAMIKLGQFRSATSIVDDKEISGNLFAQVEQTIEWFKQRMQTGFVISGAPNRNVTWEYPLDALREAVANAVCHRSYKSEVMTQIRLKERSAEFWNTGGLQPPLTHDDLLREHASIPRNRHLQEIFFQAGIVERWGTGTLRMIEGLKEQGYPAPEFDVAMPDRFRVIFRKQFTQENLKDFGLSERQLAILQYLSQSEKTTNQEYQDMFNISKSTATRELTELLEKKLLVRHGITGKGTFYTLF